jgi:hypothetical protein
MPLIDIKVVRGVFTPEEKHELVKPVSETVRSCRRVVAPVDPRRTHRDRVRGMGDGREVLHRRGRQDISSRHRPDANHHSMTNNDHDLDPQSHELASTQHFPSAPPLPARAPRA